MKYLIENYGLLNKMYECNKFLDSFFLKVMGKEHFCCTQRIRENILCMVCRIFPKERNQKFVDYYLTGHNLYYVQDDKLHIIHSIGKDGISEISYSHIGCTMVDSYL